MDAVPERLRPFLDPASDAQELARRFAAAGHRLYLVGGTVRDAFLGESSPDVDLTTGARPDVIERILRGFADHVWLQGQRFGTVGGTRAGTAYEVTTFRADVYHPESRKPDVAFSDRVEDDLCRRDFTINAMALELTEPPTGVLRLVDPHDGLLDLAAKRLRTPLDPEISFADDPLRMLRAARFVARLGLTPDPELVTAITEMRSRLEIVSAERIRDELSKLLVVPDPSDGLWLVANTHLADEFLPELTAMELEQDPIHRHKDVLSHTIAVVANTEPRLLVRMGALLHDIAKPKTRSIGPKGVSFHHHEVVGARMARDRLRALRYPNDFVDQVTKLVFLHLRFHTYKMGWTDTAVRRYVRDAGPLLADLNHLVRCDCTTRNQAKARALGARMDELERRIEELANQEELEAIRPALDGHQVIAYLGVRPGRVVGEALEHLLETRLERGPMSADDGYAVLDAWAAERELTVAGERVPPQKPRE